MDKDRHIYWFKAWRWYRGMVYEKPAVTAWYEPITVLDFASAKSVPARKTHNTFIKWNRRSLRDVLLDMGLRLKD